VRVDAAGRAEVRHGSDRARAAGGGTPSSTATKPVLLLSSNGYVFDLVDHQAIESAMARAIGVWHGIRKTSGIWCSTECGPIARGHGPGGITSAFTTTSGTHERHLEQLIHR
jgi:hypothetical protein